MNVLVNYLVLIAASIFGVWALNRRVQRTALDVLASLNQDSGEKPLIDPAANVGPYTFDLSSIDPEIVSRSQKMASVLPIAFAVTALGVKAIFFTGSVSRLVMVGIGAWSIGYMVAQRMRARIAEQAIERLEFYLPIVMERVAMAVQAGLDIIAAINVVVQHGQRAASVVVPGAKSPVVDPVTRLLNRALVLTEGGLSFEQSLNEVARYINSIVLRHAFIYLAYSYKQGGELAGPLRELSDSTQLYFQETIEERVAKLPVKATAPLLCTFAGLLICFVTVPIVQVMEITKKGEVSTIEAAKP